uniref:THAP domain-containing protein 1 B-like n=1 Tax=Monopterus albus TaxID=43700 RepID=UPI0009B41A7D|nr:THAP domain-containing protein 1 B-like [Monopterus albus]
MVGLICYHHLSSTLLCASFPLSKPQLASKWVHSLGMKNFIPTANTCLCSDHFRTDCFRDYNGKQFLREDAVPTIFAQRQDSSKIGLRKRGVIPKETNVVSAAQSFIKEVVLLLDHTSTLVPRCATKTWLFENGHIKSTVEFSCMWSANKIPIDL